MSSAFKRPSDGETHGRDSDLGHFGKIRHLQYFCPNLDHSNQPQPLHLPFLSSYVHGPLVSSPSAMRSEWRPSQKRQESQSTSSSSLRSFASSFSRSSSLRFFSFCDGIRIMIRWKGWVTTHLMFFLAFSNFSLFLLTFEFLLPPFLLQWG